MIKTLFLGSNWEALETLKTLNSDPRFKIVGVITQPDKPTGRKQIIEPSEIKKYCQSNKIQVFHTESQKEKYDEAKKIFNPELIVCKSFGEIVPGDFLEYPKYKSINVHYSLLPKYRGAVPIQMAIMNGDDITGITIVEMVERLDAGPILAQFEEKILTEDTNQTLRERLVKKNCEVLGDTLFKWCNGEIIAKEQDESQKSFCWQKDISKDNAQVDFINEDAIFIERKIRALLPWPVAWCEFKGKRIKIFKGKVTTQQLNMTLGEFYKFENNLYVNCKSDALLINELQMEGKGIVSGEEFARGYIK